MADRTRSRLSLVRRTRLAVAGAAAAAVLLAFSVFYVSWLRYTLDTRITELGRQTTALAEGVRVGGALWGTSPTPTLELRRALFRTQARLIGAHVAMTDAAGAVRFSSDASSDVTAYRIAALGDADVRGVRSAVLRDDGARWAIVAAPLADDAGYVVALQSVAEIRKAQDAALGLLAFCGLLALLVGWLVGWLVSRGLTARLLRLERAAQGIAAGEWGRQVEVEGGDELASLAASFNAMSSRVAAAYGAQKEFVGNVSHELRTPITSIQGYATALLDGVVDDEVEQRRFLEVIRDEAARLGDLAHTLLGLADIDAGRIELSSEAVDTEVLADVLRARQTVAGVARGVKVTVSRLDCDGAVPRADGQRLLQVASALMDNAIAYTPTGGSVEASAAIEGGRWVLRVDDSGPGVPPEQRERIFERFVRLDPSRSSETGGSGLGLAISARLVRLMGGTISVTDGPLGGARFQVSLPLAAEPQRETTQ